MERVTGLPRPSVVHGSVRPSDVLRVSGGRRASSCLGGPVPVPIGPQRSIHMTAPTVPRSAPWTTNVARGAPRPGASQRVGARRRGRGGLRGWTSTGVTTYVNEAATRLLGYSARELLGGACTTWCTTIYADGSAFPAEDCPIYGTFTEGITQRVGGDTFWQRDGTAAPGGLRGDPGARGAPHPRRRRHLPRRDRADPHARAGGGARRGAGGARGAGARGARGGAARRFAAAARLDDRRDGAITWYNQRWYDYTGTTLEEMKGWGWQKVHHPDYVEPVTRRFAEAVERGEPWEDTFPLRSADGSSAGSSRARCRFATSRGRSSAGSGRTPTSPSSGGRRAARPRARRSAVDAADDAQRLRAGAGGRSP